MLDFSIKYKEQLQQKYFEIWFKEKYKYFRYHSFESVPEIATETWNALDFVSIDKNDNIIGNIFYQINRETNNVHSLGIINFSDDIITFGKDLLKVFKDIFEKFNFNKLSFSVIMGNPAERHYDKIISKYGGRIIGIEHKEVKLFDGKLYDKKLYEIVREDYLRSK